MGGGGRYLRISIVLAANYATPAAKKNSNTFIFAIFTPPGGREAEVPGTKETLPCDCLLGWTAQQ